jgi:hypothetical protein
MKKITNNNDSGKDNLYNEAKIYKNKLINY